MLRTIFVVSDLHLGGAPASGDNPGFQMCPPAARARLARMIRRLTATPHDRGKVELVINGDFIDFLAEAPFASFTADPSQAQAKLQAAIEHTHASLEDSDDHVFDALADFAQAGHRLTILLGNHDIELSLPPVRNALLERLSRGRPALITFLYDGEAYSGPGFLIEHGNRADGWNMVAHGPLRALRSALSRGEQPPPFPPPPGSRLVVEVMNGFKERYRFVDLLKPENEAAIPLLAALEPDALGAIRQVWRHALEARWQAPRPGRAPRSEGLIADVEEDAPVSPAAMQMADIEIESSPGDIGDAGELPPETQQATKRVLDQTGDDWETGELPVELGQIADAGERRLFSVRGLWRLLRASTGTRGGVTGERLRRLRQAFVDFRGTIAGTFRADREDARYEKAARRLAGREGRVVVFGHTHLPKDIALGPGRYLNTGTWCRTIALPDALYAERPADATVLAEMERFVADLRDGRLDDWCRLDTYCARLVIDGQGVTASDLCRVDDQGELTPCTVAPASGALMPRSPGEDDA